jgi:alkylation response protein AidB-like acyl-CoA dehydrogenase
MDFRKSARHQAFRREVQEFIEQHVTDDMLERAWHTGTLHNDDLHRAIAQKGWVGAPWPVELGGLGTPAAEFGPYWEAMHYAGAPVDGQQITEMVAQVIVEFGTDEQKRALLPGVLAGDTLFCLGFSEPESGSDLASVKSRADRVDGGYVINAAKMFTTLSQVSNYAFLLARTDPSAAKKHKGLTMFLVPLDDPGVEIRPIRTFGGERTNATFYTDVFVPDSLRIGPENAGWSVIAVALEAERASIGGYLAQARRLFDDVLDVVTDGGPAAPRPELKVRLAEFSADLEAAAALVDRCFCQLDSGEPIAVSAAMTKLFVTEVFKNLAHAALDMIGPEALLAPGHHRVSGRVSFEHVFRHSQVSTIYGGSSEVQRNIIAGRGLGLGR